MVNRYSAGVLIVAIVMLAGCDLFQPRTPEPPNNNTSPYQWLQPTSWDIVMTDLELAFKARDRKYFMDVLADTTNSSQTFQFIADPNVASTSGLDFSTWSFADEDHFLEAIFSKLSSDTTQTLRWSNKIETTVSIDQMEIQADYELILKFNTESRATYPEHFSGQALLLMEQRQNNNYWQIIRWEDAGNDSLPCWTYLKTLQ